MDKQLLRLQIYRQELTRSMCWTIKIVLHQPWCTTAGTKYPVCIGSSTTLNASAAGGSGNYYYVWQPSGLITSGSLNITPTSSTTYSVIAYDMNGCPGIPDTISATVYSL